MKAIINRSNSGDNAKIQEERKIVEMQRKLQKIEDEFARSMGFNPRTVVYGPFDRDFNRKAMIDYLTEQYYPLNLDMGLTIEEFRVAVAEQMHDVIERQLDNDEKYVFGFFKKQFLDQVFLFSNNIKHNMSIAENILTHESLHAGIFDLMRGKIQTLKVYKSNKYDDEFFLNLITEHKMRSLVNNRNNMVLTEIGIPDRIFQFCSYEEEFVMFNTACAMIERELQSTNINFDKIMEAILVYCGSAGIAIKPVINNKKVNVYGKEVSLNNYLKTYFDILRGPVSGYDEKDRGLVGVIEPIEIDKIHFEEKDSKVPELVDELVEYYKTHRFELTKEAVRKIVNNFCQKYKLFS